VTTDRLLDVLSANLEPVTGDELRKGVMLALTIGGAAALGLMLITVGPRPELSTASHLNWLALKLLFALSLVAASTPALIKSLRPGAEGETQFKLIFSPLVVVGIAAVANLLLSRCSSWRGMLLGAHPMSSVRCVLLSLFFATIPMTILMWALRRGAPTRLARCGEIAGIVAGAMGAAAYAFNCRSDSMAFIAVWYSAGIMLCALIGAQLGPRFLRW
jgi:hypothetical protein